MTRLDPRRAARKRDLLARLQRRGLYLGELRDLIDLLELERRGSS